MVEAIGGGAPLLSQIRNAINRGDLLLSQNQKEISHGETSTKQNEQQEVSSLQQAYQAERSG